MREVEVPEKNIKNTGGCDSRESGGGGVTSFPVGGDEAKAALSENSRKIINVSASYSFLSALTRDYALLPPELAGAQDILQRYVAALAGDPLTALNAGPSEGRGEYLDLILELIRKDPELSELLGNILTSRYHVVKSNEAAGELSSYCSTLPRVFHENNPQGKALMSYLCYLTLNIVGTGNIPESVQSRLVRKGFVMPQAALTVKGRVVLNRLFTAVIEFIIAHQPHILYMLSKNRELIYRLNREQEFQNYIRDAYDELPEDCERAGLFETGEQFRDEESATIARRVTSLILRAASIAKAGKLIRSDAGAGGDGSLAAGTSGDISAISEPESAVVTVEELQQFIKEHPELSVDGLYDHDLLDEYGRSLAKKQEDAGSTIQPDAVASVPAAESGTETPEEGNSGSDNVSAEDTRSTGPAPTVQQISLEAIADYKRIIASSKGMNIDLIKEFNSFISQQEKELKSNPSPAGANNINQKVLDLIKKVANDVNYIDSDISAAGNNQDESAFSDPDKTSEESVLTSESGKATESGTVPEMTASDTGALPLKGADAEKNMEEVSGDEPPDTSDDSQEEASGTQVSVNIEDYRMFTDVDSLEQAMAKENDLAASAVEEIPETVENTWKIETSAVPEASPVSESQESSEPLEAEPAAADNVLSVTAAEMSPEESESSEKTADSEAEAVDPSQEENQQNHAGVYENITAADEPDVPDNDGAVSESELEAEASESTETSAFAEVLISPENNESGEDRLDRLSIGAEQQLNEYSDAGAEVLKETLDAAGITDTAGITGTGVTEDVAATAASPEDEVTTDAHAGFTGEKEPDILRTADSSVDTVAESDNHPDDELGIPTREEELYVARDLNTVFGGSSLSGADESFANAQETVSDAFISEDVVNAGLNSEQDLIIRQAEFIRNNNVPVYPDNIRRYDADVTAASAEPEISQNSDNDNAAGGIYEAAAAIDSASATVPDITSSGENLQNDVSGRIGEEIKNAGRVSQVKQIKTGKVVNSWGIGGCGNYSWVKKTPKSEPENEIGSSAEAEESTEVASFNAGKDETCAPESSWSNQEAVASVTDSHERADAVSFNNTEEATGESALGSQEKSDKHYRNHDNSGSSLISKIKGLFGRNKSRKAAFVPGDFNDVNHRKVPMSRLINSLKAVMLQQDLPEDVKKYASGAYEALTEPLGDFNDLMDWLGFVGNPLTTAGSRGRRIQQWTILLLALRFKVLKKGISGSYTSADAFRDIPADKTRSWLEENLILTLQQIERMQLLCSFTNELGLAPFVPLPPLFEGGREGGINVTRERDDDNVSWKIIFFFELKNKGPVQFLTEFNDNSIKINIVAEKFETMQLVNSTSDDYRRSLEHHGLNVLALNCRMGTVYPPTM